MVKWIKFKLAVMRSKLNKSDMIIVDGLDWRGIETWIVNKAVDNDGYILVPDKFTRIGIILQSMCMNKTIPSTRVLTYNTIMFESSIDSSLPGLNVLPVYVFSGFNLQKINEMKPILDKYNLKIETIIVSNVKEYYSG